MLGFVRFVCCCFWFLLVCVDVLWCVVGLLVGVDLMCLLFILFEFIAVGGLFEVCGVSVCEFAFAGLGLGLV